MFYVAAEAATHKAGRRVGWREERAVGKYEEGRSEQRPYDLTGMMRQLHSSSSRSMAPRREERSLGGLTAPASG
jgi:hypothetical protein